MTLHMIGFIIFVQYSHLKIMQAYVLHSITYDIVFCIFYVKMPIYTEHHEFVNIGNFFRFISFKI